MDHRAKLEWARKHLDALDASFDAFSHGDVCQVGVQFDAERSYYEARLRNVRPVPPEWSLMIGDILHNTRSALDALVFSLACKDLGRTPTKAEANEILFPIVDDLQNWCGQCERRLKYLGKAARAEVFWVQPCIGKDPGVRHALSVLRDLSNMDKHRHVIITVAVATSSAIELEGEFLGPGAAVAGYRGPLVEGAVIARWNFALGDIPVPLQFHGEVDAKANMSFDVQFGPSEATPAGGSVVGFLTWLLDWISADVFPPMEGLL